MTYIKFHYKAFIILTLVFILMTVIGTVTHELGHYSVAKYLGYNARINYKSSSYWDDELIENIRGIHDNHSDELKNNLDFRGKEKYLKTIQKCQTDNFWITLGGPLQTILTGSLGLFLLITLRRKYITLDKVSIIGWSLVFISLFWLRQVANLFVGFLALLIKKQPSLKGDEIRLAIHLDINIWTIQVLTGLLGLTALIIVLKLLPKKLLFTFLLSGLIGGVLGYYLWLIKFGQYKMP